MEKTTIMNTKLSDLVQLLDESQASTEMGEAFSSFMLNPTVAWAKFVLTDDRKNANGQRIPVSEFDNLIKSGIHMPVKMATRGENLGHSNSKPLGVITHLKKATLPDGANAIVALAALWDRERHPDVEYIRERFKNNLPVNVSWEILFEDSIFNETQGSMDLCGTVLRATTIVEEPAYNGRTQFLAVAAKKWSKAFIDSLPDSSFLYIENGKRFLPIKDEAGRVDKTRVVEALSELGNLNIPTSVLKEKKTTLLKMIERFEAGASVDEIDPNLTLISEENTLETIEELKAKLEEVTAKLNEAIEKVSTKEAALAEKNDTLAAREAEMSSLTEKITNLETELASLREFKASAEAENQKKAKLEEVRTKFLDAGIVKEDNYFTENAETLIALNDESLNFMIQELKAFAESGNSSDASKKMKIPALESETEDEDLDPKALGRALRKAKEAKK